MSIKSENHYRFIDIFKFFCSFLIIGIHTAPFGELGILDSAFGVLTRIAVPFFFVSSSFFLFKKEFSWSRIARYCKRLLLLYVVYSLFYVIYELATGQFFLRFFLVKFFFSGYQQLWFLQQSVIAVLVISLFIRLFKNPRLLYILSAAFYVIGVFVFTLSPISTKIPLVQSYHSSFLYGIIFERSWIFYAVPYMAIGYYFAQNGFCTKKISAIGIAVSLFLLIAESFIGVYIIHVTSTVLWLSVLPLSFFIFSMVAQINLKGNYNVIFLRKSSTLIYCIHLLIVFILESFGINHMILFISTSVLSFLYSVIVIKLSSLRYLRFLKILY